jgi:hypothetical protein
MLLKAVAFDWGHTVVDENRDGDMLYFAKRLSAAHSLSVHRRRLCRSASNTTLVDSFQGEVSTEA